MQAVAPVPRRTRPALAGPVRRGHRPGVLDRGLRPPGWFNERTPGGGRHRTPGDPLEQADAHDALQLAELLAGCGLGEAERLRGGGDATGLYNREEGP
ncbi:hypothetical protein SAMN04487779_101564 [Belnapia rosea]|uniref:Uncharacterized protein n=1 Tax=Belnapia rosea TaxID=938405 RepID=A0A1G6YZI4_9PROT|nr:hypothetical protein SAMN04487779_101564 [Belnapia rosea]